VPLWFSPPCAASSAPISKVADVGEDLAGCSQFFSDARKSVNGPAPRAWLFAPAVSEGREGVAGAVAKVSDIGHRPNLANRHDSALHYS